MANRNGKDEGAEAPPYVSFRTLWNFLDRLGDIGTPPRIDRSVWGDSLSGGYGFQLMAALRFLGLTSLDGVASAELRPIAEDVTARRSWLRERLVNSYDARIRNLDLSQATMQQLQEAFRDSYSISGATSEKAVSFFLHAAKAAEIPLSPYIERNVRRRTTATRAKKKPKAQGKPKSAATTQKAADAQTPPPDEGERHERIITLHSGGTVRVSMSYNAFKLSKEDRDFVFDLVDKIQGYESKGGDSEG